MLADTHTQRVLDLASQKGLLCASDLDAIDAPRVVLTHLSACTRNGTESSIVDDVACGSFPNAFIIGHK
jgi:hypothetical protein